MFGTMGLAAAFGFAYWMLWSTLSPEVLLLLTAVLLALGCFAMYRVMVTWGVRKWDSLQT